MDLPINFDDDVFEPETFANNEMTLKIRSDPSLWFRTLAKRARASGEELINSDGAIVVTARSMKCVTCLCGCADSISEADKEFVFDTFYSKANHEMQNEYLRGCTAVFGVHSLSNGNLRRIFIHKLHFQYRTVYVCQKFFLAIHGINRSRLRRKVLNREVDIKDGRGRHPNHYMRTTYATRDLMRIFFQSLPARPSHYSANRNPGRLYMESHWTVTALFQRFFDYFPRVQRNEATIQVFRSIFKCEFNIKFGLPRTDKCDTCSKFLVKLVALKASRPESNPTSVEVYNQHTQHLDFADVFYRDMSATKLFADHHFALCMDYQQNMPLPVTRINKEFYLRQLWVYNFGIKDLKTGRTAMFLYSENFAKKGANEVISCLLWYIENIVPVNVTSLSIFCDNPAGQNKNRYVYAALQHLVNSRFERIYVKYPIPGHSRMPIDADFGLIEKKKRMLENIFVPSDVVKVVKSARNESPFDVFYVNHPLIDDMCSDGTPVIVAKDYKEAFLSLFRKREIGGLDFNSIRELRFMANYLPVANFSDRFTVPAREVKLFSDSVSADDISQKIGMALPLYQDFLPINLAKVTNLKTLLPHIVMGPETVFFDTLYGFEKDGYRQYVNGP